ncbi:MAG: Maf family protein [Oscillospiraceae bacterium]|nr:Maf family protein [Oscillospiraceae bacterium]
MLILASASPRRSELLRNAGFEFKVIPAENDEIVPKLKPEAAAVLTAESKALEVAAKYQSDVVLAADTIVFINGEIMNKPENEADAFRMLSILSSARHTVITAVCIIHGSKTRSFYGRTSVEFNKLSDSEIKAYIKTGEPFDKAGAYGIQEKGALLVKGIRGDFFNVMGLPLARTAQELKKFGVEPK